jgi:methylamine dehydrogenase heavy chain
MLSSRNTLLGAAAALVAGFAAAHAQTPRGPAASTSVPQAEVSDVATMPASTPRWVYILAGFGEPGARIFDGETGKMKGLIEVPSLGNLSLDPKGRYYFVAETIWSKINRGVRQDMVSIYDMTSLKLLAEVPMPGRLLGGTLLSNFAVSGDGKLAFAYNMSPSSSVEVVDLEKRKLQQTVQLPGCAAIFPSGTSGVSALCADGSLATIGIEGGKATVSHTAPFFSPAEDPVFDLVAMDRAKNTATFISYTGKVYSATLGAAPQFSKPWSMQAAVGMREAANAPNDVSWIPGGRQPFALNRATGRLYVLMHMGEQWSHKEPGEEIWVVDTATHKVVSRNPTPSKIGAIQVSQEAKPLIYLTSTEGKVLIVDAETMETKHTLEHVAGGLIVNEPS